MVIARLLTPSDIGVFSVTMVLLTYVATVRDMGAGAYLVQEKDLTVDRIKAVWAVQLGLGIGLSLVVLTASVPVAYFYNEPTMRNILIVVAFNYAINPIGSLTYAWQVREMRYGYLALVRFTSTLTGAIVSIYLAWIDLGPISLAIGSLATTIVNAAMAVFFRPKWFPWTPGIKELKRVLAFGSQTTGASVISTISGTAPELFLGKFQGMQTTGLYSRASGLVAMFYRLIMDGIASVAISWFAMQIRNKRSITLPFLKATSYVSALGFSFSIGLIFLAHPSMRILYGSQWDGAVDLTRILAIGLFCSVPAAMCGPALLALGEARLTLRCTALGAVCTVILTAVGSTLGLLPMGVCFAIASMLNGLIWLRATQKLLKFKWLALLKLLRDSVIVGCAAGIVPAIVFIKYGATPISILSPLAIGIPGGFLGFFIAINYTKHPILDEWEEIKSRLKIKLR